MLGRRRLRRILISLSLAALAVAGTPTAATAAAVPWAQVSTGFGHTCGIKQDSTLWCWGDNTAGELGLGRTGGQVTTPTRVGRGINWWKVSVGSAFTCALTFQAIRYC